jgi:3-methyladenine DNA glycosylase AlkD
MLTTFVQQALAAAADPAKAASMQAYMKTDMPFYGVQKAGRTSILREARAAFRPKDEATWRRQVEALWALPHREEKYLAITWARKEPRFVHSGHLDLFEHLIRDGAWWDLVDDVAANLVGRALLRDRAGVTPVLRRWLTDDDVWIRRTTIIAQLKHKRDTDTALLFDACRDQAADTSFWIRKAIGWALREYGKTDPDAVIAFVEAEAATLSGLSKREALRRLRG